MSAMQKQSVVGKDVPFERIRRITGYLVGTMDKWNDAKRAEERDRVKHDRGARPRQHRGRARAAADRLFPGLPPPLPRLPEPGHLAL